MATPLQSPPFVPNRDTSPELSRVASRSPLARFYEHLPVVWPDAIRPVCTLQFVRNSRNTKYSLEYIATKTYT